MGITEEEEEEEVEEVEDFSPNLKPGEFIVEETTADTDTPVPTNTDAADKAEKSPPLEKVIKT